MNFRLLIITLAAPTCILAGEPDSAKHSVTQESSVLLKETFPYQPTANQEVEEKKESSDEIVKMEPFVVADWLLQRELSKKMESDTQKIKIERFSIIKGGAFLKNDRYEIGAWGDSPDLKIFADDAKYTDKKPVVLIGLLHLKF